MKNSFTNRAKLGGAAALALAAGMTAATTASAGNLADATVEAPVVSPAPVAVAVDQDWTGFYGGLSLGYGDASVDPGDLEGNNETYGVHAGYNYDFGNNFVLGGEVEYSKTDIDLGSGLTVDDVARLKVRGGYDLGSTLIYATAGAAHADTSIGSDTGQFIGIGADYRVSEKFTIGGELLEHRFDDVGGSGADADATTFSLRGSYNF
ncbi:MAG: outer membrane protein [Sulfitobacter sp.]